MMNTEAAKRDDSAEDRAVPKYKFVKAVVRNTSIELRFHIEGLDVDSSDSINDLNAKSYSEDEVKKIVASHLGVHDLDLIEVAQNNPNEE